MFGLALLFVYVFLLSFYHFDHLAWGRVCWSLCLSCICLLAMHTLICVTFFLPPGVRDWLRLLHMALPELFCLPFLHLRMSVINGGLMNDNDKHPQVSEASLTISLKTRH